MPRRKAAIEPVQAPVNGSGIATNSISPIRSYFSMSLPCCLVRWKTQFTSFLPVPILLIMLANDSKKSSSMGTGSKLPVIARQNAQYQGMWKIFMATGRAPRSSIMGNADMMMTISSRAMFRLMICSSIL